MPSLGCPRCHGQLNKQADGRLSCKACNVSFPHLQGQYGGINFLWPEPGAALLDWRNRCNAALADIEQQILLSAPPADTSLPETTQARMAHLERAYRRFKQEFQALTAPLKVGEALAQEVHLALKTKLPSHHGVLSYAQNMHRDWCWGGDENQQVLAHLCELLQAQPKPASILVLGCGAGRLAYDLHRTFQPQQTWALDSNPVLCLLGAEITAGGEIPLTEFPLAPINPDDCAVVRTLAAPQGTLPPAKFNFVCADALHPPFNAQQFDWVVTPWLIDVIDADLKRVLDTVRFLLKPEGHWITHGSVGFSGKHPQNQVTAAELAEISNANGFRVESSANAWLPYMQSPASRAHRRELTYSQVSRCIEPLTSLPNKHQHLPDWIVDGNTPVPLTPAMQTQITTVRVHGFIMSLIDGKRTLKDMAQVLEAQRLMPAAEAAQAIRGFLTTMYEEAQRNEGTAQPSR